VGECASTGAHGANRLASNSLLESLVFAARIADRLRDAALPPHRRGGASLPPRLEVATLDALRHRMSAGCGVIRDGPGLTRTLDWIEETGRAAGWPTALVAARLVVAAALARRESRGSHQRSDHPDIDPLARRSRFVRDAGDGLRPLEQRAL